MGSIYFIVIGKIMVNFIPEKIEVKLVFDSSSTAQTKRVTK